MLTSKPNLPEVVPEFLSTFPEATENLRLQLWMAHHAKAEKTGLEHLARLLDADVPAAWPPVIVEPIAEVAALEWMNILLVHRAAGQRDVLAGMIGVARWPEEKRTLQYGLTLLNKYQARGLAEEVTIAATRWALGQDGVDQVFCDIPADHGAAAKVLRRAGFTSSQDAIGEGLERFVLR